MSKPSGGDESQEQSRRKPARKPQSRAKGAKRDLDPRPQTDREWIAYIRANYPRSVLRDLIELHLASQIARRRKRASTGRESVPEMSDQEWEKYLRTHYPKRVIRDLIGLQQSTLAGQQPRDNQRRASWRPKPKRRRRLTRPHLGRLESDRWITHTLVLGLSGAFVYHTFPLMVFAFGLGVGVTLSILTLRYVARGVSAFVLRRLRSSSDSRTPVPRLHKHRWDNTSTARLLSFAALILPPEFRSSFVEEQCANLLAAQSRGEWIRYLVDLDLPRVAWAYYSERKRESAK